MEHRATRVDGRKGVAVQLLGVRAVPEGGSLSCEHVVWEHGRARVPITTTPDRGQQVGSGAPAAGNRSERVICERIMGGRRPGMARMHARRLTRACWCHTAGCPRSELAHARARPGCGKWSVGDELDAAPNEGVDGPKGSLRLVHTQTRQRRQHASWGKDRTRWQSSTS